MTGADLVVLALPGEGHRQLTIRHAAGNGADRRQLPSVTRSSARLRAAADSGAGFGACRPWFWWLQNILFWLGVWRLAPSPPPAAAEPLVLAWLAVLGAPAS